MVLVLDQPVNSLVAWALVEAWTLASVALGPVTHLTVFGAITVFSTDANASFSILYEVLAELA